MPGNLETYLHDHLAGAQFATSLLADMAAQSYDKELAGFAGNLLEEIESDEHVVEQILSQLDAKRSILKDASAWLAQKVGRAKLQIDDDRFSIFESLELLSIGILGKLALWKALLAIAPGNQILQTHDFDALCARALQQHVQVERWRLAYAASLIN